MTNTQFYDCISIEILELLMDLSDYINRMTVLNNHLFMTNEFNGNPDFIDYIHYFGIGISYHFRCLGTMESLVFTKCCEKQGLCYWKNDIVMPTWKNITQALEYLNQVGTDVTIASNPILKELTDEVVGFRKVTVEIMDMIECYQLPC